MGDLVQAIARMKNRLETVSGIGKVYDHIPNIRDAADEKARAVSDGRLHLWWATRGPAVLRDGAEQEIPTKQQDTIIVRGFYALDESAPIPSEVTFSALVDRVLVELNRDRRLDSKLGFTVELADPPALQAFDLRHWGPSQTLCHHAEIALVVVTRWLD